AKELGISTHKIICRWIKHYENEGLEGLEEKRGKTSGFRKGCSRKNPLTLEERVVRLEAENEYLKKWLSHLRG
ncbi:transposase, partial [Brevibacillus laterosporus]